MLLLSVGSPGGRRIEEYHFEVGGLGTVRLCRILLSIDVQFALQIIESSYSISEPQ